MMMQSGMVETLPANPKYDNRITLGEVTIADSAKGSFAAGVITPPALREAILNGITNSGFYNRGKDSARYLLTARLERIEQDILGWEMSAIASIHNRLTQQSNGKEVYAETVSIPATLSMGDVFDGHMRARLVTGKAISENITHFIRTLSTLN